MTYTHTFFTYRSIYQCTPYLKPLRGCSVLCVQLTDLAVLDGEHLAFLTTEHEIVKVCNEKLGQRFQLGTSAPASQGPLREALGHLSDTAAAQEILSGTYRFPPDSAKAMVHLLKETAAMRLKYLQDDLQLTTKDFMDFWYGAKEKTSSSLSGRHFGHFKAIRDSHELSHLLLSSLNLSLNYG